MTTSYSRRELKSVYLGYSFFLIMSTLYGSDSSKEPNAYDYCNDATALPLRHLQMSESISAPNTFSNFAHIHPSPIPFETNFCLPQLSAYPWAPYLTMPKCSPEMTVGAYANPSTFSSQAVNSALSDTWSTSNLLTRDAQDLSAESTEPLGSRYVSNLSFHGKSPTASS